MSQTKTLEEKLLPIKLTDRYTSWIIADLTEQERSLLTPSRYIAEAFHTNNLGYIDPSKVKSYFCGELNQEFIGPPILNVYIEFEEDWEKDRIAGQYAFRHTTANNKNNYLILFGYISKDDVLNKKINPAFVKEDNSGKIIPITKEIIQKEINNQLKAIDDPLVWSQGDFRKAERLVELTSIDLKKEIEEARKYGFSKYVEKYSSSKHLDEIFPDLEESAEFIGHDEGGFYEDQFSEFIKLAAHIKFPADKYRQRAVKILNTLAASYESAAIRVQKKLEEETKNRTLEINSIKSNRANIVGLIEKVRAQ
jgi:hypothetical protein